MPSASSTPPLPPRDPVAPSRREPEYILGADEQESVRLGLQHRLWAASAHALWERARIQPGMSVLDVGCGPGAAALDLAEIVGPDRGVGGGGGGGRVVGIDESPLFLKQFNDRAVARRLNNTERILGDVQNLAELIPGHGLFDLAYARWVLCFTPDPGSVVRSVARLLKPGGRFVIQDYFNYESMTIAPRSETFSRVVRAISASWRARGGDPDIVARLPAMLRASGLALEHLEVNQRIARPGESMWHWPDSFWRSYLPRLVENGHLDESEADEFRAFWAAATADPDSFISLPPVWDLIATK